MYPRVGIDEVGRGPIAGPVTVCGVVLYEDISFFKHFSVKGIIKDSKKLTPQKREAIYATLLLLRKKGKLEWRVKSKSAMVIDRLGINVAVHELIKEIVSDLDIHPKTPMLLDGGLRAPRVYTHQQTIIHGDAREEVIALASIIAKVHRDRYMERFGYTHSQYGFEEHKGYGTKEHYRAIKKFGILEHFHRKSFLKKILSKYPIAKK